MKQPLHKKIQKRLHIINYDITHPLFFYRYIKRFSKKFSQSDLEYCIAHLYEMYMGKKLNLDNVNTFNEKLNWLKCFYHDDRMTECANKVTAPGYFTRNTGLGEFYLVRNLGVYDSTKELEFDKLPERFVLKSNWGSAKQIIVKNKRDIDSEKVRAEMEKWLDLRSNHYYFGFEYGYKNIIPKIVCEEFIEFEYKIEFFCFNGKPLYYWIIYNDKTDEVCADFYDANTCKKINLKHIYPNSNKTEEKPEEYEHMKEIAHDLSNTFPFVRIDFFKTPDGFKFSEMTFYHWCGIMKFEPEEYDLEFGKLVELPQKKI